MKFPDPEEIVALASSPYERELVRAEFAPGLGYYLERIDRLMFRGDRVLDAGCGAGQWSLALAQRFRQVDAVDLKPERLAVLRAVAERMGVGNIKAYAGPLEQLSCEDAALDAIFCYGVLMLADAGAVLRQFHRVLRPGGRVYVCLNADGWSRYLAEEKGKDSPHVRRAGLSTLYTTYWQRAVKDGLREAVAEAAVDFPEGLLPWENRLLFKVQRRMVRVARRSMAALGGADWRRSVARDCLCRSGVGRELLRRVQGFCGEDYLPLLLDGVSGLMNGNSHDVANRFGPTRAYRPEEFAEIARAAGFADFQWSTEGGLICDWPRSHALTPCPSPETGEGSRSRPSPEGREGRRSPEPRYPGYWGEELCVWECLLVKPDRPAATIVPERHYQAAQEAAATRVYAEIAAEPVLSNASTATFPPPLVAFAHSYGETLGGDAYLRRLAATLVDGAESEEEAVRRILRFVQRAVFRDPVVQPLAEGGAIPDALAALWCARGRCGHTAKILVTLLGHAGMKARVRQLPRHVVAEARCGDRWVLADADAFKGGIVPQTPQGRLLSMDEVEANPYLLDRFPPTGWMILPNSRFTRGVRGQQVRGYVDALEPDQRGFVSGYYVPWAGGFPPSLPKIRHFHAHGGRFALAWEPAAVREGRLLGYRVRVGSRSRVWTYEDVFSAEAPLAETASDVLAAETGATSVEGPIPPGTDRLFASVTAVSDRLEKEPLTFFWPSEEARCDVAQND